MSTPSVIVWFVAIKVVVVVVVVTAVVLLSRWWLLWLRRSWLWFVNLSSSGHVVDFFFFVTSPSSPPSINHVINVDFKDPLSQVLSSVCLYPSSYYCQWLGPPTAITAAAVGAWDIATSQASGKFFYFTDFFFALIMTFFLLDYMHDLWWWQQVHTTTKCPDEQLPPCIPWHIEMAATAAGAWDESVSWALGKFLSFFFFFMLY